MNILTLLSTIALALCLVSCTKEKAELGESQINLMTVTDSCSYVIDGKSFTCDRFTSFARGNAGANLDTAARKWDTDTSQYHTTFTMMKYEDANKNDDGYLNISFIKKYGKNQLTKTRAIGIPGPVTEMELYAKGEHNFAIDYNRSNAQNGVAIDVLNRTDSVVEHLTTYIYASAFSTTSIGVDCQNNSNFQVLQILTLPNGTHVMEAKFTANVFNQQEKVRRLENGYIRIHID